jgi:hypothetical protein
MNLSDLEVLIIKVINKGICLKRLPNSVVPSSYLVNTYLNSVEISEQDLDEFIMYLKEIEELKLFNGSNYFIVGNSAATINYNNLAHWLLSQSILLGTKVVVERLQKFLNQDGMPIIEVLAICGLQISSEYKLFDGIKLVPFNEKFISKSFAYDSMKGIQTHYTDIVTNSFPIIEPTAALIRKYNHKYKIESNNEVIHSNNDYFNIMQEIVLSMNLIDSLAPAAVAHWFNAEDWVPCSYIVSAFRGAGDDLINTSGGWFITEPVIESINNYFKLDRKLREKLGISLKRLGLAKRRPNYVDKAIDLRIAFESLLIDKKDGDASISYLLKTRGCYLYDDNINERARIIKLISKIYGVCSTAVHTGQVKSGDEKLINEGSGVCLKIIKNVIYKMKMPDWDNVILTCIVE